MSYAHLDMGPAESSVTLTIKLTDTAFLFCFVVFFFRKYEEIYPPEVDEFVYITDDTYTKRQLLRMEHLLLKVLAFDLTVPTINQFLLQYIHRHGVCFRTENFARVRITILLG